MRKLTVLIGLLLVAFIFPLAASAEPQIKLIVDGKEFETEIPPQIIEGTTMASIRIVADIFGAEIGWDDENQIVSLGYNNTGIALAVGHETLYKVKLKDNGELEYETISLSATPKLIDGRVFVPVKYIAWAFGAIVEWNSEQYAVLISTNSKSVSTDQVFQQQEHQTQQPAFIQSPVLVPEQQPSKPQYGAEPIKGPQDYLSEILNSIEVNRAENPIYLPFPPGTKTLKEKAASQSSTSIIPGVITANYWLKEKIDNGQYLLLNDGSLWEVSLLDRITTILWLSLDKITIVSSNDLQYPFLLVNTSRGESVKARFIGK